jgi:hypothetical protein
MMTTLSLARIADGTSNTFMLMTRYAECGDPAVTSHYSASPIGTILAAGGPVPSKGVPTGRFAGAFFGAGPHTRLADAGSSDTTFQLAPKVRDCISDPSVLGHSYQASGISIALADGTVRSIDPEFSTITFSRAICPGDGYPLTNEWSDD